jgi:predicted dehydrogenase
MTRCTNRRDFLRTSAAAGVGFWVAGTAAADEKQTPLETVRFACIGVGGKGRGDTEDAAKHGTVVAICDVDERRLGIAAEKYPKAKTYTDYRKMVDEMAKSIDAVTVSTPDHSHAPASALAMRAGKHCFTQKPLTHTLYEARRLGEIAREMKVTTQMGNQGTAGSGLRTNAAQVRAGALGMVKEVHVWTDRPIWPQGGGRPAPAEVPANLKWDLWLGPTAVQPYGDGYHPFAWRGFWDFGTGALGDMACHTLNQPFMALDLRDPIAVEAESSGHNKIMYPKWSIIKYWFPARGSRPALTLTWYDGGKRPAKELLGGTDPAKSGSLMIGEKGSLYSPGDNGGGGKWLGNAEQQKVEIVSSPGHFAEFVKAIKTGTQSVSNFPDYAGPLTETVLLGNLAVWAGKKVEWDAKNLKATNAPEVEALIRPEYRKGWTL